MSFFVKSLPRLDLETRKMIEKEGMFGKEVQIYAQIFSKWPQSVCSIDTPFKWRPECYLTRPDILVLEDLKDNYRQLPMRMEYNMNHCRVMIKSLAKMHASSISFEKHQLNGDKLDKHFKDLLFENPLKEGNAWFISGLELIHSIAVNYSDYFKSVQIPSKTEFMDKLYRVYKYRDEIKEFEKVLCHRDIWNSNLFFSFSPNDTGLTDPSHCLIVDYQICCYQSPVMDLLIAIQLTTRREFRNKELKKCFQFYKDYMRSLLKQFFHFTDEDIQLLKFLEDNEFDICRDYYLLYPMVANCIYVTLTHLEPGKLNNIQRTDPQRYYSLCNVNRNEFVRENMEIDAYYRDYVLEVVGELLEYLLL